MEQLENKGSSSTKMQFEKIVSQASNWNFEGDISFLKWMTDIGNNLQIAAQKTTTKLDDLSRNVAQTSVALDNAANTLHYSLHYSQYVESRCQEEDEYHPSRKIRAESESVDTWDEKKDLETFLENNLKVIKHIDLQLDSDESDEENSNNKQPRKSHADEFPFRLPHIIDTKLWHQKRHVGLCDSSDENSDNESFKQASILSSSSSSNEIEDDRDMDDSVSYQSSETNSSIWPRHQMPQPIIAESIPEASKTKIVPNKPIADSDSIPPRSLVIPKSPVNITSALPAKSDTHSTSTTTTRRDSQGQASVALEHSDDVAQSDSRHVNMLGKTVNLFDDNDFVAPISEIGDTKSMVTDTQKEVINQLKGRLDLFAEDAELRYPAQESFNPTKSLPTKASTVKANSFFDDDDDVVSDSIVAKPTLANIVNNTNTGMDRRQLFPEENEDFTDIFSAPKQRPIGANIAGARTPKEQPARSQTDQKTINETKTDAKKDSKPINLFGDDDSEDFWSSSKKAVTGTKPKVSIQAKSLFDDDEDHDAINDIIGRVDSKIQDKSRRTVAENPQSKIEEKNTNIASTKKSQIFDTISKSIFADDDDDFLSNFSSIKSSKASANIGIKNDSVKADKSETETPKPLFDDESDDDFGDIFSKKPSLSKKKPSTVENSEFSIPRQAEQALTDNLFFSKPAGAKDNVEDLFCSGVSEDQLKHRLPSDATSSRNTAKPKISLPAAAENENLERSATVSSKVISSNTNSNLEASSRTEEKPPIPQKVFHSLFDDDEDDDFEILRGNKGNLASRSGSIAGKSKPYETAVKVDLTNAAHIEEPKVEEHSKKVETTKSSCSQVETEDHLKRAEPDETKNIKVISSTRPDKSVEQSEEPKAQESKEVASDVKETIEEKTIFEDIDVFDDLFKRQGLMPSVEKVQVENVESTETAIEKPETADDSKEEVSEKQFPSSQPNEHTASIPATDFSKCDSFIETESQVTHSTAEDNDPKAPSSSFLATTKLASQNYNSLFFDEPPDDDAFFERLGSTSIIPNIPKNASAWEDDDFESNFDVQPTYASSKDDNPKSSYNYDVCLFSDIPPEDSETPTSRFTPPSSNMRQAVSQIASDWPSTAAPTSENIPSRSSTPADDAISPSNAHEKLERTSIISKAVPSKPQIVSPASKVQLSPENPSEVTETKTEKAESLVAAKRDLDEASTSDRSEKRVSKLKMPDFKINVQALLPPSASKVKHNIPALETDEADNAASAPAPVSILKSKVEQGGSNAQRHKNVVETTTAQDSNLLSSLCKTRVKPSNKRRPSTRRGRQESLLQSQAQLLNEELQQEDARRPAAITERKPDKVPSIAKQATLVTPISAPQRPETVASSNKSAPDPKPATLTKKKPVASLFEDSDSSDDSFANALTAKAKQPSAVKKPMLSSTKANQLFSDSEEDDGNDLFLNKTPNRGNPTLKVMPSESLNKPKGEAVKKETATFENPLSDLL